MAKFTFKYGSSSSCILPILISLLIFILTNYFLYLLAEIMNDIMWLSLLILYSSYFFIFHICITAKSAENSSRGNR